MDVPQLEEIIRLSQSNDTRKAEASKYVFIYYLFIIVYYLLLLYYQSFFQSSFFYFFIF
jgi:hypothetical protein